MLVLLRLAGLFATVAGLYAAGPRLQRVTHLPLITIYLLAGMALQIAFSGQPLRLVLPLQNAALGVITIAAGSELIVANLRANARAISAITCCIASAALIIIVSLGVPLLGHFPDALPALNSGEGAGVGGGPAGLARGVGAGRRGGASDVAHGRLLRAGEQVIEHSAAPVALQTPPPPPPPLARSPAPPPPWSPPSHGSASATAAATVHRGPIRNESHRATQTSESYAFRLRVVVGRMIRQPIESTAPIPISSCVSIGRAGLWQWPGKKWPSAGITRRVGVSI